MILRKGCGRAIVGLALLLAGCNSGSGSGPAPGGPGVDLGASTVEVWGIVKDLNKIRAVDVTDDLIAGELELPAKPYDIAYDQNTLWVVAAGNTVFKVKADTLQLQATYTVGNLPARIRAAHGSVWLAEDGSAGLKASVIRLNPSNGAVIGTYAVGDLPDSIGDLAVTDDGGVVAVVDNAFALARVTPSGVVTTKPLGLAGGYGYGSVAVSGDSAYVTDQYKKRLITMSISSMSVSTTVTLPFAPLSPILTDGSRIFWGTPSSPYELQVVSTGASAASLAATQLKTGIQAIVRSSAGRIFLSQGVSSFGELNEIDPASAAIVRTAHGVFLDEIAAP